MSEQSLILVGNDKGGTIAALRCDGQRLLALATTEVGVGCATFAVDRERNLVYAAVKEPEPAIVTLHLDRETGALTEEDRVTVSDPLAYVALTEYALLGASYHGGWGASWRMDDGVVGPEASRFEHRNVHAAVPDVYGQNAYFPALGDDLIAQFSITMDGQLVELSEPVVKVEPGSGPRHIVVAPDDRNAYLITEFTGEAIRFNRSEGGRLDVVETVETVDESAGLARSAYGLKPREEPLIWAADIALAGEGRWLLCSERSSSKIGAVELNPRGHLTENVVWTTVETQPRGLDVAPGGELVVVVGEESDHAALYRLDEGGRLLQLDRIETGRGPNWVRFV